MFEQILSAGRKGERKSVHVLSFPAAVGFHMVAFAWVVGASMGATEEPPDPEVPVIFRQPAAPAGPAGVTRGVVRRVEPPRRVARQASFVAPRELPLRVLPAAQDARVSGDADLPDESPGDREGPGGAGVVPGGIGDGEETLIDLSGTRPPPAGDFRGPELVRRVEPDYPEVARRARLEGLVVIEAIAASGDIEEVRVIKSAGTLLDSAAEEAVRRWKYRPATLNGRGVRVRLSVKVSFRLH